MSDADADALPAAKPKFERKPESGGTFPDIGELFNETIAEFSDDMVPYVMAGVAQFVVVLPLVLFGIFGMYIGMFVGMGVIMAISAIIGGLLMEVNEALGALVMLVGQLGSMLVIPVAIFVMVGLMVGVMSPLNASLVRAAAAHQRGEKTLDFAGAFSTITQDIPRVLMAGLALAFLGMIGAMFCYLPALLVLLVFGFVSSLVALHRQRPGDAFRTALATFRANQNWHLMFGLVYIALTMAASNIPVLGSAFLLAFHTRAHRKVFGDDEEPALA